VEIPVYDNINVKRRINFLKVTMVIPSYWSRSMGWSQGDAVYDHPTPLNEEGTLSRVIQSLNVLDNKDFKLIIIAVAASRDIESRVEQKVSDIIKSASALAEVDILLFGPSKLKRVHELLNRKGKAEYNNLLQLKGYSNIRNLCLFLSHVLDSEAAMLIDDDEMFDDPTFMSKAREFIGKKIGNNTVNAVAGYYQQPDGDYYINKKSWPWMKYWDSVDRMNEAFDMFIGTGPRLKETPFAFGGNMVIHRDLFTAVPFDPCISRGEDIDYLINSRMFGFHIFIDNKLSIRHLPPPKTHQVWKQLREDIYRFIYERAKIEKQQTIQGMTVVNPADFDPYPGNFLKPNLLNKIEMSCMALSEEYLTLGDGKGSAEALNNITIAKTDAVPSFNPFMRLCELQKQWKGLMEYADKEDVRSVMAGIVREI